MSFAASVALICKLRNPRAATCRCASEDECPLLEKIMPLVIAELPPIEELDAKCLECGATAPLLSVRANAGMCFQCEAVVLHDIDCANMRLQQDREDTLDHEETELS